MARKRTLGYALHNLARDAVSANATIPSPAAKRLGLICRCAPIRGRKVENEERTINLTQNHVLPHLPIFNAMGRFLSSQTFIKQSVKKLLCSLSTVGILSVSSHPLHSLEDKSVKANGTFIESSLSPRLFTPASVPPPLSGAKNMKSCGVDA